MRFGSMGPTPISYKGQRFLIMDAPTEANLHLYVRELIAQNVAVVVRTCAPTYPKEKLIEAGIQVKVLATSKDDYMDGYISA